MEAMVALAVLAGGIVWLFQSYSMAVRSVRVSREKLQAAFLLEGRLWDYESQGKWRGTDPTPEESSLPGPFTWERASTDEAATTPPLWHREDLSLTWGDEGGRGSLSLSVYRRT